MAEACEMSGNGDLEESSGTIKSSKSLEIYYLHIFAFFFDSCMKHKHFVARAQIACSGLRLESANAKLG